MISKSFKKQELRWILMEARMNILLAIAKRYVEEMKGEVDQTPNDENKEPVDIEIVKEEVDNPSDENYSIILAESDDEEEEKEGT